MVTHLYVLRHGIAQPHGTPGVPDSARVLTPKGEERVGRIARRLHEMDLSIEAVVTSPLPRARRTAEIVAHRLGLEDRLTTDGVLTSGSPPRVIRDWISTREESHLMVVGHNPDLTELVALLTGVSQDPPPFDLKKGGIAALKAGGPSGFTLRWLATPGVFLA